MEATAPEEDGVGSCPSKYGGSFRAAQGGEEAFSELWKRSGLTPPESLDVRIGHRRTHPSCCGAALPAGGRR